LAGTAATCMRTPTRPEHAIVAVRVGDEPALTGTRPPARRRLVVGVDDPCVKPPGCVNARLREDDSDAGGRFVVRR
ncbi:MAG TPA: hypothetical protein VK923_08960, partial [Euzebyales bacterium]|nr:hypothetical protein [Euzebyales bacterium]